jgi:hypothetical protein
MKDNTINHSRTLFLLLFIFAGNQFSRSSLFTSGSLPFKSYSICLDNKTIHKDPVPETANIFSLGNSNKEFKKVVDSFTSCIAKSDIKKIISFFSDSLKENYKDFDGNNLKQFISIYLVDDKYFFVALKKKNYEIHSDDPSEFVLTIYVDYPKKPNEEGDGRLVWMLDFKKFGKEHLITNITGAG